MESEGIRGNQMESAECPPTSGRNGNTPNGNWSKFLIEMEIKVPLFGFWSWSVTCTE